MLVAYLAVSVVAAIATVAVLGPVIGLGAVLAAPLASSAAVLLTAVWVHVRSERRSPGAAAQGLVRRASE